MNTNDAKEYLARREIPQLFESLLNGLMCSKPEDPIEYLESCLQKVKELGGCDKVKWDTFVSQEKKTLPPLNGGQSRRSFLRNESDTDLSETAELIEEYEVFDPTRPRPKIILVIGGPGSGKGTQSLKIAERYGFQYISVGELLRKKIHSTSSNRKWSLIAKIITTGELAPQETTITEIKQKLMQIPDEEGIVIDGFPRDVAQALSFEDQICTPDLVVFLACANQRLKERLLKRAEQQGRPDDNLKATQRRLMNFKQNAAPLVKYFQEKGLIMTFDADRDEDEVFYDISMAVDSKLFPNKEAAAGSSDLDPSMMLDTGETIDTGSDYEDQMQLHFYSPIFPCQRSEEFRNFIHSFPMNLTVSFSNPVGDDQLNVFGEDTMGGFMEDLRKRKIIFMIGGPGSGKGTQCGKLVEKYGLTHLSTGDLLRNELSSESERSKLIRDIMERGDLVPSGIILELLKEAMLASLSDTKGFLIDGYPQEVKQGEEFGRRIGDPHLVICMDCSADTMTNRLLQRSQGSPCVEDSSTIAKRLEAYYRASIPVIAYYETKTQLHKVNAEGTPEEVFLQLCTAIDSIF
ncbi:adenylate kinase isoenzyme 5 isoform X2 [Lutra lutra]|uniref:adenylate kinase isoenzyme 5 isoform X2 n=1 Tax=Lutra lutra TaxID=9657 RepID=UPI001FD4E03E|nr:adenylate kinase isoenzyme 5 isoform X2 [Lutra lutra]